MIFRFSFLFLAWFSLILIADPGQRYEILHAKKPYMEWSLPREQMQRDYRLIKEGMAVQFHNFKAHLNAVLHISNPSYKRYKFVAYKDEDDNIIPIQFIDWARVPPTISHRPLDMYVTGKYTFFCLEPQNGVPLYTHDGRFYKDPDGLLRSVAHHLPVLGQKGRIYLSTSEPDVDQYGVIYEDDIEVDQFKIQKFASSKGLWTIEGTVFYMRDPDIVEFSDAPYEILQGYFEEGNEPPGMMTSPTIVPFGEGMAKSAKSYMDTYELLFKAIDD